MEQLLRWLDTDLRPGELTPTAVVAIALVVALALGVAYATRGVATAMRVVARMAGWTSFNGPVPARSHSTRIQASRSTPAPEAGPAPGYRGGRFVGMTRH